ncbi:outer membrane protein assembly factor BamA [Sphingomonas koreensis]|nr:outer membrane protein assembly factor BamA [Sphingomonas koreensis]
MRAMAGLLAGTMLSGLPAVAHAQTSPAGTPAASATPATPTPAGPATQAAPQTNAPGAAPLAIAPAPTRIVKSLRVDGSQRIEPATVLSYTKLRVGQDYTNASLDQAIRDLYASGFFADVSIDGVETGDIIIKIKENPVINRVILDGNKHIKSDKITKEIKLAPRQIFTRTAVREDVSRILELYRREGRFAANVQPQMVSLDQNRVDVVFDISEGDKSKVRQINIIGNHEFKDGKLLKQMATKEARLLTILSPNTSYDQDRMAYDQQKLRQFYLTEGYADFRVTSAVAELTPDKKDFIITYVVEEGPRYKFGDVTIDSDIRDFDGKRLATTLPFHKGDWYNAKQVEDSVDSLTSTAGLFGYAFANVDPEFTPDRDTKTMDINFHIGEAKRTYVERVDINGNTQTQDKVVRREVRLAEGDAFNTFQVKRSSDRINSLGYFQDKFELKQVPGSAPDRVVLEANLEEKSTGELQLSAGYSDLEGFIIQGGITQHNFRGKGQELRANVSWSYYSKSIELGFTEPYLFDKSVAVGGDLFRRDYNAFNYVGDSRETTYSDVSTGFQLRAGIPLTEYWSLAGRYQLSYDEVGLDKGTYYTGGTCDPLKAGRYLCDSLGNRWTSAVGYSIIYSSLNNGINPTGGTRLTFNQDFAGLGGDVRYIKTRADYAHYWNLGSGFILSTKAEGGWIAPLEKDPGPGVDRIRITDRFLLGEPQFRGFDIRGIGPRVTRTPYTTDTTTGEQVLVTDKNSIADDALGGRAYYLGHLELELPLGAGASSLGLRPSVYLDAGALFGLIKPRPTATFPYHLDAKKNKVFDPKVSPVLDGNNRPLYYYALADGSTVQTTCASGIPDASGACNGVAANSALTTSIQPFKEQFLGNSASPRLSIGIGVNWNSPFGPLRIDLAKALLSQPGDDKKLITFNVGAQY